MGDPFDPALILLVIALIGFAFLDKNIFVSNTPILIMSIEIVL